MNGHDSFASSGPQIDPPAEQYPPGPSSQTYNLNSPTTPPAALPSTHPTANGGAVPSIKLNFNLAAARKSGPGPGPGSRASRGGRGGPGGSGSRGGGRVRASRGGKSARAGRGVGPGGNGADGGGGSSGAAGGSGGGTKLKLSLKIGGEGSGRNVGFLGEYDRELDENPEEPLAFEEQFILRVPKEVAEGKDGLREMIRAKKGLDGVDFKFLDPRRAAFRHHGTTYAAKLVDLPCIIESQKTVDNRHLFKVADISQMLVVTDRVASESSITSAPLKIDEYIWPHGITPPLRHVRKRRFRKRLSRRTIEVVEEQVEELLKKDEDAEEFSFDLIDPHPDPDIPDSYYVNWSADDPYAGWHHNETGSEFGGSELYDDPGSNMPEDWDAGEFGEGDADGEVEDGYDDDGDGDGVLDEDLQAALMEQMERSEESGSEEGWASDDDDDDDGARSEEDEETTEQKAKIKQYSSEIKQLETLIEKKRAGFTGGNPIITKRFEETIAGLQADVNTKVAARQALIDELDKKQSDARAIAEADAQHATNGKDGAPTGGTGASTPFDGDMDMDGEGEYDGATPGEGGVNGGDSLQTPMNADGESLAGYSEDEDLFGDGDESGTEDGGDKDGEGEDEGDDVDGDGDGDVENEMVLGVSGEKMMQDDEMDGMAALLEAELGKEESNQTGDPSANSRGGGEVGGAYHGATGSKSGEMGTGTLDQSPLPFDSSATNTPTFRGFTGIEGGVGMRRLASGVAADDDDDDSGSSEDSDD